MRLRIRTARPVAQAIRARRDPHLPAFHQALHGRAHLGRRPHQPLLHPRHPPRRKAGFVLPLLLGLCGLQSFLTMQSTPPPPIEGKKGSALVIALALMLALLPSALVLGMFALYTGRNVPTLVLVAEAVFSLAC